MSDDRERISAAVVLIIFLIGAIVVYLVTLPQPIAYRLIFGNFSTQPSHPSTNNTAPLNSFYYQITSYLGGNPSAINSTYSIGTFGTSYDEYNSSLSNSAPFTLTSSIFGSSSYNIGFNGSASNSHFLSFNIGAVSGSPTLKIALNGNYFYQAIPGSNEHVILKLPTVSSGNNVVSIYNYLNGFAFTQAIDFSNVTITQMYANNASHYSSVTPITLSGLGNYYLQFTPIGYGNLSVSVDGYTLAHMSSASDSPYTIMLPPNVVNQAIKTGNTAIIPVTFNVGFSVGPQSTYEIANAAIVYTMPQVTPNSMTIPYTVKQTTGEYVLTFYVSSILNQGPVTFTMYPSGQSFQISSTNLVTGENILIIPKGALAGQASNGNYTGTMALSTTGLIIPDYISLKPTS